MYYDMFADNILNTCFIDNDPYAWTWSCPNGLRLVFTAKTSLSQFSGIHESEKRSPNALGRPTAKSANYQA